MFSRMSLYLLLAWLAAAASLPAAAQGKKEPIYDGKTLSQWIQLLKSEDKFKRLRASITLEQVGPVSHDPSGEQYSRGVFYWAAVAGSTPPVVKGASDATNPRRR